MEPYAIIESGSKQHLVKAGDMLDVELLGFDAGKKIELQPVLAISDGATLTIGTPVVKDAKVTATVIENFKDDKVVAFKIKRRKGYSRKVGHRQSLTSLKIESIKA